MHIIDAIVLAKLLSTPPARRVLLHTNRYRSEEGDQRNEIDLRELAGRVRTPPDGLVGEVAQARHEAERLLKLGAERGYEALAFDHAAYPAVLATIADPPPVLWLHGDRAVFTRTSVAIVGSRAGSSYACEVAQRLGTELSDRGVTVVSGLARGVDGAAHRGALLGPGGTIAVLGSGLDVIYPPEHVALARSIVSDGAVVTEYPPGVPPLAFHFPRRNRIISGLVRAVVVVEASQRSGSLITARCAADQGREVMAVPGNVLTGRSRGGHALIKDGAKVVETADDILEEIGPGAWGAPNGHVGTAEEAEPLLLLMDRGESYDLDTLAALSGLGGGDLLARVLELELQGRIVRSGVGRFSRSWGWW